MKRWGGMKCAPHCATEAQGGHRSHGISRSDKLFDFTNIDDRNGSET